MIKIELNKEEYEVLENYLTRKLYKLEQSELTDSRCYKALYSVHRKLTHKDKNLSRLYTNMNKTRTYAIQNGEYYLSNHYEPAAEAILGYGGVYSKTDIKKFYTLREANAELKKIRTKTGNRSAKIVEINYESLD